MGFYPKSPAGKEVFTSLLAGLVLGARLDERR